jgi:outer membrane protein assembly factor BamB
MRAPRSLAALGGALPALLVALVAAPVAALAAGGDLIWTFQGIEDVICAGEILDTDADGTNDIIVETYDAGATGDHLWCLSGGSHGPAPDVIWSVRPLGGPSNSGGYGDECVRVGPDLNGDLHPDVLLGTAWGARTAFVINGKTGGTVWKFDTYSDTPPNPPVSGWVYSMISVPDTDFDKVPDVFFVCGSDNDNVYHMSGDSGDLIWVRGLGDGILAAQDLGDVSGDGLADGAFGVGDFAPAVWVMKGGTQGLPTQWNRPTAGSVLALERIEDLTSDGIDDLIVGTWDAEVLAFDAASGDTIWQSRPSSAMVVMRIENLGDVDGDSIDDVVVGSWDDTPFVLSGADGTVIWDHRVDGDVWAVDRLPDVTGDGIDDVVIGSFDHFVYALDGTDGSQLWKFDTGNRLYWVMGTSDLTGNGIPDVFAGSQKLSGPGGHGYLLEGGDDATSVDLPMRAEAHPASRGMAVRLEGARGVEACWLERVDGSGEQGPTARRFEDAVIAAHRAGELTVAEALAARSQDPHVVWTRVADRELPVVDGRAAWVDTGVEEGREYTWRFALVVGGDVVGYSPTVTRTVGTGAGRFDVPRLLARPNPVPGEAVTIEFRLPSPQAWRLEVIDPAGRRVATIDSGEAGERPSDVRVAWNGRDASGSRLPNGVYFLRLEGRDFVSSEKITLLR